MPSLLLVALVARHGRKPTSGPIASWPFACFTGGGALSHVDLGTGTVERMTGGFEGESSTTIGRPARRPPVQLAGWRPDEGEPGRL